MSEPVFYARGGYADVWDMNDGTVIKAYRSEARSHGRVVDIQGHNLLTSVFCAKELNAYNYLANVSGVKEYIPKFFGQVNPCGILLECKEKYVGSAGLRLEKVEGQNKKISNLEQADQKIVEEKLWEILQHLNSVNVWDASCFYVSEKNLK